MEQPVETILYAEMTFPRLRTFVSQGVYFTTVRERNDPFPFNTDTTC